MSQFYSQGEKYFKYNAIHSQFSNESSSDSKADADIRRVMLCVTIGASKAKCKAKIRVVSDNNDATTEK
ncbi:hypothetical protein ACOSP7_027083 [Xanthoceras sorbifolium]